MKNASTHDDRIVLLDGPTGTELLARGVPTLLPAWSAAAIDAAPDVLADIHADYARACATVHSACTFRTTEPVLGSAWRDTLERAVAIAKSAVPAGQTVAGAIAPRFDCYRSDLAPPREESIAYHGSLASALAAAGCDLLLCETFPSPDEGLVALDAALSTGLPAWLSLTSGPLDDQLTAIAAARAARRAVAAGAGAVLVNCLPVPAVPRFIDALVDAVGDRVPVGAYANAGTADDGMGFSAAPETDGSAERFADAVLDWIERGATIVGGCCGTSPAHVRAIARRIGRAPSHRPA